VRGEFLPRVEAGCGAINFSGSRRRIAVVRQVEAILKISRLPHHLYHATGNRGNVLWVNADQETEPTTTLQRNQKVARSSEGVPWLVHKMNLPALLAWFFESI